MTDLGTEVDDNPASESTLRRVAVAALSASTLEWFDFYIYGTAAALVFNEVFFPEVDPTVGTLAAFATFGVGFMFRPVGGILFGHFGDRLGRKKLLVIAMVMMGAATALIGALPTYAQVGILAPILLVVLRSVQGIAVGGQYGGAMLMVTENAPPHRRGFYGSFAQIGPTLAVILSNLTFLILVAVMPSESFASWGWRIPFLLSVIVIALGLWVQVKLEDTPAFKALEQKAAAQASGPVVKKRSPILEAIRTHPGPILKSAGILLVIQVYFYTQIVFMVSYMPTLGVPRTTILTIIMISSAVVVFAFPVFAGLSDRLGRKKVVLPAAIATLVSVFPFFLLMETATIPGMMAAALIGGLVLGALYGPLAAYMTEMFSAEIRYSGASIGYQLAAVVGGGFAPLIAASLLAATGTILSVAAYITVAAVITLVAVLVTKETYRPGHVTKI
ncbi:metabolite-proton symporter [Pseudonocardia sediminis]|uniref:Putative proline/betaine transporter n=1 Tax=Pseudonocardia sediminis TaxID=1397368 RepID=A0A4Q7UUB9_PSEST|nr:MFS transporter [Pseudonocardia sediminis]RZT85336.1 metabolite-proton symporter [Pseudonocardia sediminis]